MFVANLERVPSSKIGQDQRIDDLSKWGLDDLGLLESRLNKIVTKAHKIDAVVGRLDGMPIQELMLELKP